MRSVLLLAISALAAAPVGAGTLTIVLDFQGPHSEASTREMEREFESIMRDTGLRVEWRRRAEADQQAFDNLVLVRFKGKCVLEPIGYLYDERGPLAFTYSQNGSVQPFTEVACDRVTASVRSAMWGGDFRNTDALFGRALGRVLAHELVHILTQSGGHQHSGVERAALSGALLISPRLHLTNADIDRLRAVVSYTPSNSVH